MNGKPPAARSGAFSIDDVLFSPATNGDFVKLAKFAQSTRDERRSTINAPPSAGDIQTLADEAAYFCVCQTTRRSGWLWIGSLVGRRHRRAA